MEQFKPQNQMTTPRSSPTKFLYQSPYSVTDDISLPPFHPSQYQQQMISNQPDKFHSHFIKLRSPNKKGQARYRCVRCSHEFECTGKLRLIQHIVGSARSGNQSKNVRSCPLPYEPLKLALLKLPTNKLTQSPSTPIKESVQSSALPRPSVPENIMPIASTASTDSIVTVNQEYNNELSEFTSLFTTTEDEFLSDIENDEITAETPSKRSRNDLATSSTSSLDDTSSVYSHANQALIQFLSNYRLPVTAVEDPLFLELISAIRLAGPSYRPSMIGLLQDTQMLEKSEPHPENRGNSLVGNGNLQDFSPRTSLQHGNVFSVSEPNLRSTYFDHANRNVELTHIGGNNVPKTTGPLRQTQSFPSINFPFDYHSKQEF